MYTWGFAPCASPQAVTWRAFSPQNVQAPSPGRMPGSTAGGTPAATSVSIRVSDCGFLSVFGIRLSGLLPGAIDLFAQHIHRIDNADDDSIHRRVFETGGKPGAAALA